MARRRLPPPITADSGGAPDPAALSGLMPAGFGRPPVARVAAESAAEAALREVSQELAGLRAEGRMVLRLDLEAVELDWLIRDRIGADPEELAALVQSLDSHGQRTPIEVAELAPGRYGLISGWRRMMALRQLSRTDPRFGQVLALVRRPETAAEAYVAMVEENEVRAALSYWERARVVARAVAGGVFETEKQGLQRLFATASRARRSKIGSFLGLVNALDGILLFPTALPERAGLELAKALEGDADLPARLQAAIDADRPATPQAEQALIARLLRGETPAPVPPARREIAPGLWLEPGRGRLTLGGPGLTPEFLDRLEAWLSGQ